MASLGAFRSVSDMDAAECVSLAVCYTRLKREKGNRQAPISSFILFALALIFAPCRLLCGETAHARSQTDGPNGPGKERADRSYGAF